MFGDTPETQGADVDELKFGSECLGCKFHNRPRTCRRCDSGELFEELDPAGVDSIFFE